MVQPALGTAGFRTELRELLLRATERGITPERLAAWGRRLDRSQWVHAAAFAGIRPDAAMSNTTWSQ